MDATFAFQVDSSAHNVDATKQNNHILQRAYVGDTYNHFARTPALWEETL